MSKLLIVESPAKAKTINKYLGNEFEVLASYGHIRDLPSKSGSVIPQDNFKMIYEANPTSSNHIKKIADCAKKVDEIYLATDPDREGEAISWHIIEILKQKKIITNQIIKRVVFNEITKNAVKKAIENPRDIDMNLVNAQQARRALDYLVGFTLSPLLWRKLPGSKSAGRVQSVALRLICEREQEIERFVSEEYWDIKCAFEAQNKNFKANLVAINNKKLEKFSFRKFEDVEAIVEELKASNFVVSSVERKEAFRNPQAPFTTSTLQQEASRKLGFSAKLTMQLAQRLYEGVNVNGENIGLITYMRTDGVQVSEEAVEQTRRHIGSNFGAEYLPKSAKVYQTKAKNAQEAHEAIRPTNVSYSPDSIAKSLDELQYKLYKLIWQRMVASQMNPMVLNVLTVNIEDQSRKYQLRSSGSTVKFDGFYRVYQEGKEEEDDTQDEIKLPNLNANDLLKLHEVIPAQHFTEPAPRYSEASLVKKLEELGIGRPSTYASIISVLQERNYVIFEKKKFIPEERGMLVNAFLTKFFEKYVEYNFTAELENGLDEVSAGKQDWKNLLNQFWVDFENQVSEIGKKKMEEVLKGIEELIGDHIFKPSEANPNPTKCPECDDGTLGLKLGKFGAFVACSNYPECKHTAKIEKENGEEISANEDSIEGEIKLPKVLGMSKDGFELSLRKGPYGYYVQKGNEEKNDKKEIKRVALPKNITPSNLSYDQALMLSELPKEIAIFPDTNKPIMIGIGRFGPYLAHDSKFISISREDNFILMDKNRAISLVADHLEKSHNAPKKQKILKEFEDIQIIQGAFGVKFLVQGDVKIKLDKKIDVEQATKEELQSIIAKKKKSS
ncbi:type I DNA topoisomerase [Rickettsiales endosymbiont of Stachyamoeba lipophora]|uniref:type I DNA topoisomerase n=1 Tax=Rickettsiales endosymbiont of Stachyamoeba lipophora TaxID=2486578 RepID=UPI000F64F677|nr:type I DNA topoisomerase [Rickettsiales endosymbiont of Stachyamoeba lipophora]AZL16036.1 type I DNA topoisomerase [Rickettsiales endosymbiont of Stachyamoeba lipophora]